MLSDHSGNNLQNSKMKVCIQSKKWMKPATPTPPHLHNHQLSSIDQLQIPFFVPLIFRYHNNKTHDEVQTSPDHDQKQRIGDLEESLSKILTLYYPYAGRYDILDESSVSCQDQGLQFVVATVDCKLAELDDGELYDEEALLSGLDKGFITSRVAWAPVVSVQVNVFSCGGLAIGLSFLHKVSDIFTFSTFMDAWATTSRLGTLHQLVPPNFTISSLLPPKHYLKSPKPSEMPPPKPSEMQPPPRFVKKRFIFTKEAILKLKSSVAESNMTNYTRVQLLTALLTRCLVKTECAKGAEPVTPFVMFQMMNIRSRAAIIPREDNLCGNLYTILTARGVENESWELHQLADLIRNSVNDAASDIVDKDWGELGKKVENEYMELYEESRKGKEEVNRMMFTSWCRFGLNDIDFGWGKPCLVSTLSSPFAVTYLIECTSDVNDGGIEAWVCLTEDEMASFQNKPDILEYALYPYQLSQTQN